MVKEKLGVKTLLGVSNISFGLPNRKLINETFSAN
ncbi:MAG: 5-methyltetrahydrofolate-homocysteine methyltransferase [Clostridium butyricum DORA_1]|nr:MAG: 5-methyltetrahydrofolate-homocysteine methyltransferase [Clostridium butyricum DORA_1]